jgi:hypothetical protein
VEDIMTKEEFEHKVLAIVGSVHHFSEHDKSPPIDWGRAIAKKLRSAAALVDNLTDGQVKKK